MIPQVSGLGSWVCGRSLTEEEVQELERVMMNLALGNPNLSFPDFQWAAGNTAFMLNSEIMAAEGASQVFSLG